MSFVAVVASGCECLGVSSGGPDAGGDAALVADTGADASTAPDAGAATGNDGGVDASAGRDASASALDAASPAPDASTTSPDAGGSSPDASAFYTTNFPLIEDPISEGGRWHHVGASWTSVQTTGGLACGTENNTQAYDDSYAYLTGFPADVHVTAVMHNSVPNGIVQESEILFRWSDTATTATGYEVNLNSGGAAQIVRWDGLIGVFQPLPGAGGTGGLFRDVVDGDVFEATISGSMISMSVNGVLLLQVVDSTYATGNAGIGFFSRYSYADNPRFGFTSVTFQGN